MTLAMDRPSTLSQDILDACAGRAADYDRTNTFFKEDWDAIKDSGFLTASVPKELGGGGLSVTEVCSELQALAQRAPATALAVNMHLYWTGVAAEMRKRGDDSLDWILREAVEGEIFAAGHAETGNDLPVLFSTSKAERVGGGYRITGHKMFGSLSPVWTRLGIHAMDTADPAGPQIIHAFMPRDTEGYTIKETWDTMGMRATRSDDTILDGVFIPDRYIARKVPAGGADLYILCLFAVALTGITSVYLGIAHRALQIAVKTAKRRTSLGVTRSMAYHPEVQHAVADMAMRLEAMDGQFDRLTTDWDSMADYDPFRWILKIVSTKTNVVEGAKQVVDRAMDISGGAGMFKASELERLYRDVRCGGFHPANNMLTHELVAKITLGIDLGEEPRWG